MSATGVFTLMPRVEFVKGEITTGTPGEGLVACGPGTAYPLEVTLDQLAEMYYRVRDSVVNGEISCTQYNPFSDSYSGATFHVASEEAATLVSVKNAYHFGEFAGELSHMRGYCTLGAVANPYFGASYYSGRFETGSGLRGWQGPARDALDTEYAMWVQHEDDPTYGGNDSQVVFGGAGLSHEVDGGAGPLDSPVSGFPYLDAFPSEEAYRYASTSFYIGLLPYVAWTDGVSPIDPASRLFVRVKFYLSDLVEDGYQARTDITSNPSIHSQIGSLSFVLSETTVACPLYSWGDANSVIAGDMTVTATKWWPYARADGPVWDANTGAFIPIGTPTPPSTP